MTFDILVCFLPFLFPSPSHGGLSSEIWVLLETDVSLATTHVTGLAGQSLFAFALLSLPLERLLLPLPNNSVLCLPGEGSSSGKFLPLCIQTRRCPFPVACWNLPSGWTRLLQILFCLWVSTKVCALWVSFPVMVNGDGAGSLTPLDLCPLLRSYFWMPRWAGNLPDPLVWGAEVLSFGYRCLISCLKREGKKEWLILPWCLMVPYSSPQFPRFLLNVVEFQFFYFTGGAS